MSNPVHTARPVTCKFAPYITDNEIGSPKQAVFIVEFQKLIDQSWPELEVNARLLQAAYNAFDSAANKLGINAVELADRMQEGGIADLIQALSSLVSVCEHRPTHASGRPMAPMLSIQGADARKRIAEAHAAIAKASGGSAC
jgi:hypothetical protein